MMFSGCFGRSTCAPPGSVRSTSPVPPTLNLDNRDLEIDLDIVAGAPREQRIDFALNNSFGFGVHNVALAFGRA